MAFRMQFMITRWTWSYVNALTIKYFTLQKIEPFTLWTVGAKIFSCPHAFHLHAVSHDWLLHSYSWLPWRTRALILNPNCEYGSKDECLLHVLSSAVISGSPCPVQVQRRSSAQTHSVGFAESSFPHFSSELLVAWSLSQSWRCNCKSSKLENVPE